MVTMLEYDTRCCEALVNRVKEEIERCQTVRSTGVFSSPYPVCVVETCNPREGHDGLLLTGSEPQVIHDNTLFTFCRWVIPLLGTPSSTTSLLALPQSHGWHVRC
ncbi:hypothetical protein E2C01_050126 [Portunus trituberculatus]|uniref:Uncharacterized protein n=1 Tax=Portunus trituberculatus TaxID=210409 RepID=A0A5B7GFP2_PORTR|nr:hypothetical protein [Portunus trituberculatus]